MTKKKNISQEDINTWKNYIKNPTDITDKDNIQKDSNSSHRFKYDLHGFTLLEANEKVREIILDVVIEENAIDAELEILKKNYDKAYDYFFAEFMAVFSCVQYQWISDIVNRD